MKLYQLVGVVLPVAVLGVAVTFGASLTFTYRNYSGVYQRRALSNFRTFAQGVQGLTVNDASCGAMDTDARGQEGHGYIGCTGTILAADGSTDFRAFECSIRPNGGCKLPLAEQLSGNGAIAIPQQGL